MKAPDVKALVMGFLRDRLTVPVVSTRPDDGTASFVRVINTGGPGRHSRVLQTVQLTIDSYGTSTGAAFDLANRVDALVHSIPNSVLPISRVPFSTSPSEYPDPDVASPRYSATYQFTALVS